MITIPQMKAARAMLGYSQQELADKAGISVATLNNIERGAQRDPKLSTMSAIRRALELGGIEFTDESMGGVGVRMKAAAARFGGKKRVLIVDDNHADRLLFKHWLTPDNDDIPYEIIEAENAKRGFEAFIEHNPDCVILDFHLYGMDGFQLMVEMKKDYPIMPPIIFVTGMHNKALESKVKEQGAHTYLNKNTIVQDTLLCAVRSALKG